MANVLEILTRARGGDQVKREMKKASSSAEATNKIFLKLGAALTVGAFAKGIQASIRAYAIQEKAVTRLNASLRAQNKFTEELSQSFQKQASALQAVTTFGDEAILAGQAFTLSMGVATETVQKITPIVLDFASAMGIDLQTAFRIVGQAATGETGLLKRYGIIVDEVSLKTEGLNAVLKVMENNFKGTAKAVAESGIGPLEQYQNLMGDFQEDIGRNVIPILNELIKTHLNLSKALNKNMDLLRDTAEIIKNTNLTIEEHNRIQELVRINDLKGLEAFKLRVEKRLEGLSRINEEEEKNVGITEERIKKIVELEKKRLEDIRKKREEEVAKETAIIEEQLNFRRELRELDLEEVIGFLEEELKSVSENDVKQKAFAQALANFKKELRVEEAVEIEAMNDRITQLFVDGVRDWGSAWQSFRNFVVDFILRDIASELVKTIGLGNALKTVLGGVSGGGFIGAIGGLLGFQHGGTVPGPVGQPRVAVVHGGETYTPPGAAETSVGGNGVTLIVQINGTFIEGDRTKWDRLTRERIFPTLQKLLSKTGEQFSGR